MAQITISRDKEKGIVTFSPANIDVTETVFFSNLDTDPDPAKATHWPWLTATDRPFTDNQLGPYPSLNSSQCPVPLPPPGQTAVIYGCKFHPLEQGVIHVFPPLAAAKQTTLKAATRGTAIPTQPVVTGGKSPYTITGMQFQVTDGQGKVITSGRDSIGPGLVWTADQKHNQGVTVSGTPTLSGTYTFTFAVTDGMNANLQQVQYSMTVAVPRQDVAPDEG